jgi:Domain of unknown function (DUF4412)
MKSLCAALTACTLMLAASAVHAGVVLHETETIDRGTGPAETQERTVMVQGNQQKTVTDRSQVLIDLNKGFMYVISPERKAYVEMPFPPQGRMGQLMAQRMAAMYFKKTGKHGTIAGYPCDEYSGGGNMGGSQYSVVGCFSRSAPGASDFTSFQKAMAAKLHGSEATANIPNGVPLEVTSTTKMTSFNMPGISPDQAAKIKDMLAKRPPVINKTVVTKVAVQEIAAADFTVPADYHKQELPSPNRMMGAPATSGGSGNMSSMPNSNISSPPASSSQGGSGDSMAPKLQ